MSVWKLVLTVCVALMSLKSIKTGNLTFVIKNSHETDCEFRKNQIIYFCSPYWTHRFKLFIFDFDSNKAYIAKSFRKPSVTKIERVIYKIKGNFEWGRLSTKSSNCHKFLKYEHCSLGTELCKFLSLSKLWWFTI